MNKSVVAIVANVKRFRVPFYQRLGDELQIHGVQLTVIYSDPDSAERLKQDSADLPDPIGIKVKAMHLFQNRALIQLPPPKIIGRADLVIVVQANGYLINYFLLALSRIRVKKIAFWGHAFNHQGTASSLRERFKRWIATKVDWWFTYTHQTGQYLEELGFPKERITVIENAIDTTRFARAISGVSPEGRSETRRRLGIEESASVGLFCGSLYADKKLTFLIQVGDELHERHDQFVLIIIGDGPERELIRDATKQRPWIHYCGYQIETEKAALFAASDFFLNPGLVGLGILDSFAAGLPFVTSDYAKGHSPEIAYLEHERNGLMLPFSLSSFVEGVSRLVSDGKLQKTLRQGALESAARYTLENMVKNVSAGILRCLDNS